MQRLQNVVVLPLKRRVRINIEGEASYFRLRELRRALPDVIVKVRTPASACSVVLTDNQSSRPRAFLPSVALSLSRKIKTTTAAARVR